MHVFGGGGEGWVILVSWGYEYRMLWDMVRLSHDSLAGIS